MCSEHFTEMCYERDLQQELAENIGGYKQKRQRRLKPGSVPSVERGRDGSVSSSTTTRCVSDTKYLESSHPALQEDEERAWLTRGSDQHKVLESIVLDKTLLNDMRQLTKFCHTGSLENFHCHAEVGTETSPPFVRWYESTGTVGMSVPQYQHRESACQNEGGCSQVQAGIHEALGD